MLTFYNEKGEAFGAQVEFTVKNAVNGERSVSGTIISNDRVLSEIDRGWKFEFDGEFYNIVYAKPRDEGRNLSVSFDAVHQFIYDFGHSNCYTEFNGSHRFEVYIEAIFKDSGYRYQIGPRVRVNSIRKENFGNAKRLEMFKDIIKAAELEFSVSGKVVLITKKIGADLSTVVRKNFNMNELVIEKNINKFITYKRGLGAWKDEADQSKGRYTSEYESPLASIYGRIEGEPVTDERYKDTNKLLRRLKFEVDNSYSISVQLDMEDLTRAGYQYTQPRAGDYIMAINETIGFWEKIRIVSFESSYDVTGRLINHKVTCNDIGSVQKQISSEGSIIRSVGQSKEYAESALAVATKALASADGKNTVYYGATKPKDEPIGTIRRGDILYLTAGEDTEMYTWNGAEWELRKLKLDTAEFEKKFDEVKKAAEQASEENKRRSDEAFKKAGTSEDLAKEAKLIGLDSIAKFEEFKKQAASAQTAMSDDLDILKQTVNNEVNQASEHRRTTTEALSRMTGQMNGFATKSEVAQGIDGLTQTFAKMRVGGRNFIRNYDWNGLLPLNIAGPGWKFERVEDQFAKSGYMLKATCTKGGNGGFHKVLFDLRSDEFQGKDMTWSCDIKSSRPITFYAMGFEAGGLKRNVSVSTEWERISNTFKVVFKQYHSCVFYANGWEVGDVVYIRDPQLEEGAIATTPRPAPEDGKDEILAARTEFQKTANGLSTRMSAVESYVGQDSQRQEELRRYTREESARQATAVRELVTRDYVGKATYQEDVRGLERRFSAISTQTNNDIDTKIAQYKQTVDGQFASITSQIAGKASQTDFQRVRETSQFYERILGNTENGIANNVARMALTSQLFQVEVSKALKGGRNYIRNGQFKNGSKNWIEYQSVNFGLYFNYQHSKDPNNRNRPEAHFFHDSQNVANFFGLQQAFAFEGVRGEKVSVSLLVSKDGDDTFSGLRVALHYIKNKNIIGQEWQGIPSAQITSKYKRFTFTFTLSDDVDQLNLMLFGEKGKTINLYVTDVQLERGSVATDYKEAPEDTDEAIRSVQSQLAGSWSVQNINSAGDLISGINLGADGRSRLIGKSFHITGETLIDNAVIKDGMIASLSASKITAGTIDASKINVINVNASSILAGTLTGMKIRGGQIDSINGNMHINLQTNQFIFNGRAGIEFKSPGNSLEFNSGGRKAFLSPTVSQGTNYAAFAFGVNDRGDYDPNRDFVGLKIFNEPDSRQVVIVGDLVLTSYANQGIQTTSLKRLFELIDDNFKRLREFRVQNGEGSPGFWDVTL